MGGQFSDDVLSTFINMNIIQITNGGFSIARFQTSHHSEKGSISICDPASQQPVDEKGTLCGIVIGK